MLATNTVDGDLRVWSVAKPPGSSPPRVIRALRRSENYSASLNWVSWSKNGRILQFYEGETWAWDVRTKEVTYQSIPTIEFVKGIAAYGPTGTLFTLGPDHSIQQYDVDTVQMVRNVRYPPQHVPQTPPQGILSHVTSTSGTGLASPHRQLNYNGESSRSSHSRQEVSHSGHSHSNSQGSQRSDLLAQNVVSPAPRTEKSTTTMSLGVQANVQGQPYSPSSMKSARQPSGLRQEMMASPEDKPVLDLFPFTRARLRDVSRQQSQPLDDSSLSSDDLRRQMLAVVFGWQDDIYALINNELDQHSTGTPNAIYLARWLGAEPGPVADALASTPADSALDWMRFALNSIGNYAGTKKMAQAFTQKLLTQGEIHAAACLFIATGDYNDAIEVYVSRSFYMEAVLLACLLMPSDWQRLSHLVREWGDNVVSQSNANLAVRCYSCTNIEPAEPWTSPSAPLAAQSSTDDGPRLQPSIYHKTMERRSLAETSPQASLAPPVVFPASGSNKQRQATQDGGLKLITSFGSKNEYRFPGLMSDDGTPINAALVTPIAESAIPRSAISPGGAASQRINSMRSLTSALASRTGTPNSIARNRLPSIGETSIEIQPTAYPNGLAPRAPPTPADSGSDKEKGKSGQVSQDKKNVVVQLPTLLTPARYDPKASFKIETPQTAVALYPSKTFGDRGSTEIQRPASAAAGVRSNSRPRKPEGLSLQMFPSQEEQAGQELLPQTTYIDPVRRPATTTAAFNPTKPDLSQDFMSPPHSGNSLASARSGKSSTSMGGRSLDQYISSLEQAQYYKPSRSRGDSIASKQSRDDIGEKKLRQNIRVSDDDRGRQDSNTVPVAKRSPSSPVPMSPEEIRLYTASVESFDSAYLTTASYTNRSDTTLGVDEYTKKEKQEARRRHRSRSRTDGKSQGNSRAASRRRSLDRDGGRGRSKSRREGSANRSPSSPVPMLPSDEDLQGTQPTDPALRLVTQNRQRLHHSAHRQSGDIESPEDYPIEKKSARLRSHSRQPEGVDANLSRKSSLSMRSERRRKRDPSSDGRQMQAHGADIERVSSTSETERRLLKDLQHLPEGLLRERAQAELEARRLSLTRRPSAPAVPLPGQHFMNTPIAEYPPPLVRAQTDQGPVTLASLTSPHPSRPESTGFGRSRPQTPRAMKHPSHGHKSKSSVPELPEVGELLSSSIYKVPTFPETGMVGPKAVRSDSFTSVEVPEDMPKHPMFDANIAGSRPGSRNVTSRNASPTRGKSRERRPVREPRNDFTVVTIGEEDGVAVESYYGPPIVPELQHLAIPPPPPPPPEPPRQEFLAGLRIQTDNLPIAASIPLPQSAYPGDPITALSPSERHRRDRSISDKQFLSKFQNFMGGRMRSTSRGRSQSRGRDNPTRSPNVGSDDSISPYESIQSPPQPQPQFTLSTVTEGH